MDKALQCVIKEREAFRTQLVCVCATGVAKACAQNAPPAGRAEPANQAAEAHLF